MPTTPVLKGRPPLIPVSENAWGAPSPSPTEAQKGRTPGSRSTPAKRNRDTVDSRSPGRMVALNSRCNYETPFVDDRGGKKSKILSSGKRVSFGGNSVRIISQNSHDSFSKTLTKDRETSSTYLELERIRTPPISKRNPDMVSGVNDDSDMDTFSATRLPIRISDSPSRANFRKGSDKSPRSPAVRRSSVFRASGRQSFGLFVDEDVTMACRDIRIDPIADEVTQTLPLFPAQPKGEPQEPEDEDITCTIGYGLHDMITGARHDGVLTGNKTSNTSCPSSSEDAIPEQFGLQNEVRSDEDIDPDTQEKERPTSPSESPSESLSEEHGIQKDHIKTARHAPVSNKRQDHSLSPSNCREDSSIDNATSGSECAVQTGVRGKESDHPEPEGTVSSINRSHPPTNSQHRPLIAPHEDGQERVGRNDVGENGNIGPQPQSAETMHTSEAPTRDSGVIGPSDAIRHPDTLHGSDSPERLKPVGEALESSGQEATAEYQGLLSSVLSSSESKATEKNSPVHRPADFNLDHHLRGIDVRFDNPTRSVGREASLAPMESFPPKFEQSSSELNSYELMKERYFLEQLRREKKRIKTTISSTREAVKALEKEIETLRPPMVEMLTKYDEHSTKRITAFQCAVKRLRKTSAFEARGEWVASRRVWEKEICDGMDQCCTTLEKDLERTQAKKASVVDLADRFSELEELSHIQRNYEEEGMETLPVVRRIFLREMSQFKDIREAVITEECYKKDAQRKQALLEPLEAKLSRECSELESYVGKGSPALRKMILERHEQSSIIAGVTGISLSKINTNSIALTICGLVNLHFSLHEDRVINTSCKPVSFINKGNTSVLKNLIEGAVTLSSFASRIRAVKMARDIPMVLRRFSHMMMRTQCLLEEAHRYYEIHMGSITNSSTTENGGSPSLHVDLSGCFYSVSLRSQFNVVVSITFRSVRDCTDIQEKVVLKDITRTIGDRPDDNAIQEAILSATGEKPFNLYDAFEAVWGLLR
ncbi:hypothetical protein BWQ96_01533 [Gracilariopsis chorda]|uniref:Spc7 kinetochore protein domain-containing protein n=1 Tax=Gracilariopsis chorda TaxID=448386 RepID=A0A2V3J2K8_9FLOR|nr:hypothetical protein BWQ96_01533 [Gracilariopsis chorda]|eukprot:PXF48681.1 hypothetical protein BWQ96_01533 [Gracilariopsis chorda]